MATPGNSSTHQSISTRNTATSPQPRVKLRDAICSPIPKLRIKSGEAAEEMQRAAKADPPYDDAYNALLSVLSSVIFEIQ